MSFDYGSQGYEDPVHVWTGVWQEDEVALWVWRKEVTKGPFTDPRKGWNYALDLRSLRSGETIEINQELREYFCVHVLYKIGMDEEVLLRPKKHRFTAIFEDLDE